MYLTSLYIKYNFPITILRLYQAYGLKQDVNRLIPIVITNCKTMTGTATINKAL